MSREGNDIVAFRWLAKLRQNPSKSNGATVSAGQGASAVTPMEAIFPVSHLEFESRRKGSI